MVRFGAAQSSRARFTVRWCAVVFALLVVCVTAPVLPARAAQDTAAPSLVSFSLSPSMVDTSAGPATISFTARVTDDLSGVSNASATFFSPSSAQAVGVNFGAGTRVSGDALDGTYVAQATVPSFSEQGTWTLISLSLVDNAGNGVSLTPAQVASAGLPTTFQVTGRGDTAAPSLVSFSLSPSMVDTSAGPTTISFTARVTDDLSGVSNASAAFFSPSSAQAVGVNFGAGTAGLGRRSRWHLCGSGNSPLVL